MLPQPLAAVVGIDPSLTSTGLAVVDRYGIVSTGTITSKGRAGASWYERHARLVKIAVKIADAVPEDSLVVIESPSYGSGRMTNTSQHDRSGLWWLLFGLLVERRCVVLPITPATRATYATGKGNASKDAVLAAVVKRYPDVDVTGNDVADALVLAAIGARLTVTAIDDLPKTHLRALDKVDYSGPRNAEPRPAVGAERGSRSTTSGEPTLF